MAFTWRNFPRSSAVSFSLAVQNSKMVVLPCQTRSSALTVMPPPSARSPELVRGDAIMNYVDCAICVSLMAYFTPIDSGRVKNGRTFFCKKLTCVHSAFLFLFCFTSVKA